MEKILTKAFDRPVTPGTAIHNMVSQFYTREAWLLDHYKLREWTGLLAPDLSYEMPLRITESRAVGTDQLSRRSWHYHDDYEAVCMRVSRVIDTKSAWSDDPFARFRRFVSNIAVGETDKADEFDVMSYVLVARNRFESGGYQFLTAERHDVLRMDGESFKIARREVYIDLSAVGLPSLAFFV